MRQLLRALLMLAILVTGINAQPAYANATVGDGTPGSCTNAAIINAIAGGGTVTFNCGPNNVTIPISTPIFYFGGDITDDLTIDGGGKVTLQGTPGNRIIEMQTWGFDAARTLTLRNMTITGASLSGATTDANGAAVRVRNSSALYETERPTLIVDNVTFTNNISTVTSVPTNDEPYDYGGGAIYIAGGYLEVRNSTFTGNQSRQGAGGALHVLVSNLEVYDSVFENNVATIYPDPDFNRDRDSGYGGAIYQDSTISNATSQTRIVRSTFRNNRSANQGGVAYVNLGFNGSREGSLYINGSTFDSNRITGGEIGFGGAISAGGTNGVPAITILNSSFTSNVSTSDVGGGFGGALGFAQAASVTIANTTFAGNVAQLTCDPPESCGRGRGGAISIGSNSTQLRVINSTIVNNSAGWRAGGISSGTTTTLENTIIANNSADDDPNQGQCNAAFINGGNNIQFGDGIDCAPGITKTNPLLNPLTNGYYPLTASSPAVDAGNNSVCAASPVNNIDQRGVSRPLNGVCDIGAVEFVPAATTDVNDDGAVTPSDAMWVLNRFGLPATGDNAPADIDGNNAINRQDVNLVIEAIGTTR